MPQEVCRYLEIRSSNFVVTLRAILATHKDPARSFALVSWYTYDATGALLGHANPCIFVDGATRDGHTLLQHVSDFFDERWDACSGRELQPAASIRELQAAGEAKP
jgi:hypothetical protein